MVPLFFAVGILPSQLPKLMPYPCCCRCECTNCSGVVPKSIAVAVDDIVETTCGSCETLNTTFVLNCQGMITGTCCEWRYTFGSAVCGLTWLYLRLCRATSEFTYSGTSHTIHENDYYAEVRFEGGDNFILWYYDFGVTAPDCDSWNELVFTYDAADVTCNASAATALVTAL